MLMAPASWVKEIISHPNTPAYIQAVAPVIATVAGFNYVRKRAAERKFDLVIRTYKYCLEACDVLMHLKQAPALFGNRDKVQEFQDIKRENCAHVVSQYAESYLNSLSGNQELFDNLYDCYAEMRLFFKEAKEETKPIEDLLWSRNRIVELLQTLKQSRVLIENLAGQRQDAIIRIIRDAMVQVWEDIELADWQQALSRSLL
ncbi:MAG TPA: hypothetical protein VMW24_10355 [Sedimentisphaerales bacterium]|nr:hypothetical protein [Sedimentisphaerales bacterium]